MSKLLKIVAVTTLVMAFVVAGAGSAAAAFDRDLTVGSTGADVSALQTTLGMTLVTGYFGPITKAAVVKFQTDNNIAPAAGYVGPITRGVLNGIAAPVATGATCPNGMLLANNCAAPAATGTLSGNAGDITVTSLSTYSGEKVKAGENDVKVLGLEIEADEESDVEITSMKVELKQTNTASSQRLDNYIESVDIYMGSTKVGSADASDFNVASKIYTKSVSLDGAIIKANAKAKFYVALNAVSNLDSGDIDAEVFSIDILSMRFVDADGVTSTDSTDVTARTADFEDLTTSGDVEVKVSENSGNPVASSIEVDDTSDTPDVLLLAANMKVKGTDITVDQLSFNVTPTGANANEMVSEYKLLIDGDEIDSISATSIASGVTAEIVFTDLEDDFAVADGDTVIVKLVADIVDTQGNFGNGDSLLASLTNTNLLAASSTIEDENGDTVAAGDRVGAVTGNAQAFYVDGIAVKAGTITEVVSDVSTTDTNSRGTYTIKFAVTAFGADAYVDSTSASAGTDGVQFSITGDTFSGTMTSNVTCTSNCTEGTGNFLVDEGTTKTFTLTVVLVNTAGAAGFYGVQIDEIGIGAADDATAETTVTTGLEDLQTDEVNLETNA